MSDAWDALYEQIRLRFVSVVEPWVDDIARDVEALAASAPEDGSVATLFRKFHNLAGASGTYGMHGVSTRAVEAVVICRRALDGGVPLGAREIESLRAIVGSIRDEVATSR